MRPKEAQTIEWKESWRDEYLRWICGFANAQGGMLIIGKTNKHASKPFNPLLANAFFRAGMIESWGRGIEKINQECEAAGLPVPEYRTDASGLMVQFHTGARQEEKVTEKTLGKTLGKTPEEIIALLKNDGSLSIEALAEQIGKSASAVQRALRKLQETRVIERIGPHKGGSWVVKEKP